MGSLRRIRRDAIGPFVKTGGYVFRPAEVAARHFPDHGPEQIIDLLRSMPRLHPSVEEHKSAEIARLEQERVALDEAAKCPTSYAAGDKVHARHIGGSTLARVGVELWVSCPSDPQNPAATQTSIEPGASS